MYPVQIVPCIEKVPPVRIACLKLEWTEHINHDFTVLGNRFYVFLKIAVCSQVAVNL